MCLVSVCPKGTEKNTDQVFAFIREGAKSNSDGSGFMYKRNGENVVSLSKGYFKYKENNIETMINDIKSLNLTKDDELAIHHRIGTSGKVMESNCHPFVISYKHEETSATKITVDKPVLVHNGMFGGIRNFMDLNTDYSDTYAFAKYVLTNPFIFSDIINGNEKVIKELVAYNRVCILFPSRDLLMLGNFVEDSGYFHSNGGYKAYVRNVGGVEYDAEDYGYSSCTFFNERKHNNNQKQLSIGFKSAVDSAAVFREHEVDNSRTRENRHQSTPSKSQSSLTKVLLLDNRYIDITTANVRHFNFVKKKDWDNLKSKDTTGRDNDLIFSCDNFDLTSENLAIQYKTDNGTLVFKSIPTTYLITGCYYIPKGSYYYEIYKDYKTLVDLSIQPTKNSIKSLQNIISKNYLKTPVDLVYYKKIDRKFCRKALEMHLEDLKRNFDLTPLQVLAKTL